MATDATTVQSSPRFPWAQAAGLGLATALAYFLLPLLAPLTLSGSRNQLLLGVVLGLAVGVALRVDSRLAAPMAVGVVVGTTARFAGEDQGVLIAASIGVVIGAELWMIAYLLRRTGARRFADPGDVIVFAIVVLAVTVPGGLISSALAEASGSTGLDFFHVWRGWVIDDLFGLMCIAPAILTFHRPTSWSWSHSLEWLLAVAYTALSVWYVFFFIVPGEQGLLGWPYFIIIGSLWIAVRLGTQAVAPVVAVSFWVAVIATVGGLGAFAVAAPDPFDRLLAVEMFCIVMATVIFALSTMRDSRKRRTAQVESSELLLRQVIDGSDAVIYAKEYPDAGEAPGRVVLVNEAGAHFIGRPGPDIVGRSNEELFPPQVARAFTDEDLHVVRTGAALEFQRKSQLSDGSSRVYQGQTLPLTDASGQVWGIAGFSHDVTELVMARERERRQTHLLHAVFELSPTPAVRLAFRPGSGVEVNAANAAMCQLVGAPAGDLEDCDLMEHIHPDDVQTALDVLAFVSSAQELPGVPATRQRDLRMRTKDGKTLWVSMSAAALRGQADEIEVVAQFEDFTARREAEEALSDQVMRDAVTGLPNRRALHERMEASLQRLRRHAGLVTVLFCDLDNFKDVNDSLGHHVGDRLLVEVAKRLGSALRPEDTCARLGGDEFVVFGEGFADPADAVLMAVRLQDRLSTPWVVNEQVFRPAMSVGVAMTADPDVGVDELLRRADLAMYRAKELGRNRIEVYDRRVDEEVQSAVAMQHELRRAIDTGGLRLHYQPIVRLDDQTVVAAEALVRMVAEDGSLLGPDAFIPQAEASGLIVPLGAWVVRQAFADLARMRAMGGERTMSVNVSPSQLREENFADFLLSQADAADVRPEWITIEVTETALIHDPVRSGAELARLHGAGMRVALDDFGTGYSSLSWLTQFPVNVVKVDKSFTEEVGVDERKTAIVSAVIAVSHELGFTVVAEGIESAEQRGRLLDLGCDFGQGYLFGRSAPIDQPPWA